MSDPATFQDIELIIGRILNIALTLGGIAAFIMLIIGGFKFLVSGGDPKQLQSAQQTITFAIIGLIIAIGSWFILGLIGQATGIGDAIFEFSLFGN